MSNLSIASAPITDAPRAARDEEQRVVSVTWPDGHEGRFPYIWLRHHLYFPVMGRPDDPTRTEWQRIDDPKDLSVEDLIIDRETLSIRWMMDGTTTNHLLEDLRRNCISEDARASRRPPVATWTTADAHRFTWFSFSDFASDDRRLELLCHVMRYGVAFIREVPRTREALFETAEAFGPVRRTHFGEVFDIRSTPADNSGTGQNIGATAANAQAPHCDEAFRHAQPGISMFHCLTPHPYGEGISVFLDGFAAAERLRKTAPDAFALLSSQPLQFVAERNPQERYRSWKRMIATDHDGIVRGVAVSDRTFPPLNLPQDRIEAAYAAISAFQTCLSDPVLSYERCLQAGEMVVFDNHRVLHARRAFDPSTGVRHLQQLSVDREEFHRNLRMLAEKLDRDDIANLDTDAGIFSQR